MFKLLCRIKFLQKVSLSVEYLQKAYQQTMGQAIQQIMELTKLKPIKLAMGQATQRTIKLAMGQATQQIMELTKLKTIKLAMDKVTMVQLNKCNSHRNINHNQSSNLLVVIQDLLLDPQQSEVEQHH